MTGQNYKLNFYQDDRAVTQVKFQSR
jgi:hypothetical protein